MYIAIKKVIAYRLIRTIIIFFSCHMTWIFLKKIFVIIFFFYKNVTSIWFTSKSFYTFTSYSNFQEFIDTKKVLCKCGKIITLGNTYQISNFQRHSQSNNCTYRTNNQPSINVFFSKSKPGGNDDNDEKNDHNEENRKWCAFMC